MVEGLGNASTRIKQLAAEKPGSYFVFCPRTHAVLDLIDSSTAYVDLFVHTFLFACPDCQLPVGLTRVSHKGEQHSLCDEAFLIKCPYCEHGFKVIAATAREHYVSKWAENPLVLVSRAAGS